MASIYLAEGTDYIVANNIDQAVEKYFEDRSKYPNDISLFKDSAFVITESTIIEITTVVLPTLAEADGAIVSPTPNAFIKEGDQITLQATPSVGYPTFINWTDADSNILSTSNPYTYTSGATDITINANFSA